MDNRSVDITSEGREALANAISIIWDSAPGRKATHYKMVNLTEKTSYHAHLRDDNNCEISLDGKKIQFRVSHYKDTVEDENGLLTLILLWNEEKDSLPLPYTLNLEKAIDFCAGWLDGAEYPLEPDHDGSNGKGWRVFTNYWGHVACHRYAIFGLQPTWAMYGK